MNETNEKNEQKPKRTGGVGGSDHFLSFYRWEVNTLSKIVKQMHENTTHKKRHGQQLIV